MDLVAIAYQTSPVRENILVEQWPMCAQAKVVQLEAALKAAEARADNAAAAHAAAERQLAAAGEERASLRALLAKRADEMVRPLRRVSPAAVPYPARSAAPARHCRSRHVNTSSTC